MTNQAQIKEIAQNVSEAIFAEVSTNSMNVAECVEFAELITELHRVSGQIAKLSAGEKLLIMDELNSADECRHGGQLDVAELFSKVLELDEVQSFEEVKELMEDLEEIEAEQ